MSRPSATPHATIPAVAVEVLLLRLDGAGRLAYRELRAGWWPPGTPDALALRLAGIDGSAPEATVSHSTSWRCDRNGRIVLTYAVLPDPDPQQPATVLLPVGVLCSGDPLRPSPPGLHAHHIVAHAVRHLGQLAENDPAVRAAATLRRSELWRVVTEVAAAMAVGCHEEAHSTPSRSPAR
ncbi:MAG: hypothetical protein ACRDRK_14380 [Pseudonocardia sp.]